MFLTYGRVIFVSLHYNRIRMIQQIQREKLKELGISQEFVARKLNVGDTTVKRYFWNNGLPCKLKNEAMKECINQIIKRKQWELKQRK